MKLKKHLKISFILTLLLSGCAGMTVPDIEVCGVTGELQNGMMCATSLSNKEKDLNFDQTLDFLQPSEEHGAALCMSSIHWTEIKNAIETACMLLGKKRCKKKAQEKIAEISRTIEFVQKETGSTVRDLHAKD